MTLLHVSDHAVLRYLERRYDIDVDAARAFIEDTCRRGALAGADYVTHERMRFVLRRGAGDYVTVVTALDSRWHPPLVEEGR